MKMNALIATAAALVLAAGLVAAGCKETASGPQSPKTAPAPAASDTAKAAAMHEDGSMPEAMHMHGSQPSAAAAGIAQKTCPVTGDPIDPKVFVDYKGRRIYFCCTMCPPQFNKDPEKYIAKVDAELKDQAAANKSDPAAMADPASAPASPPKAMASGTAAPAPAVWTCPMHPEVRSDKPGTCPKCGMALVPAQDAAPPPAK